MIDRTSPIDLGRPALDIGKTRKSNFIGQNSSDFWSYFFCQLNTLVQYYKTPWNYTPEQISENAFSFSAFLCAHRLFLLIPILHLKLSKFAWNLLPLTSI